MSASLFIVDAIDKQLTHLRCRCSIIKEQLRHAIDPQSYWGDDRGTGTYWRDCKAKAAVDRKAEFDTALKTLADFIAEHRPLMGADWIGNDHGRLCWHQHLGCLGGNPIACHYCQAEEAHEGSHRNHVGTWETPPPRKPKVIAPPCDATGEAGLGDNWGEREGPCVIQYRDWTWFKHPLRRSFSCLGCRHLELTEEYRTLLCHHPQYLGEYDSPQSVGGGWMRAELAMINGCFCPVLEGLGETSSLDQPDPDPIDRESQSAVRPWEDVFALTLKPTPRKKSR